MVKEMTRGLEKLTNGLGDLMTWVIKTLGRQTQRQIVIGGDNGGQSSHSDDGKRCNGGLNKENGER